MNKIFFFIVLIVLGMEKLSAQNLLSLRYSDSTSLFEKDQKHKRTKIVIAGNAIAYGGTMVALYTAWYKNYPQTGFHFFNDNKEWLQVDKVGHAWSAYNEGRASIQMWSWAGLQHKNAVWIGGLSGLAYQSIIEVLDGFSSEWGFSWGDYLANISGSSLLIGQELGWEEQRILFKFSATRRNYESGLLNKRANSIYGSSLPERILKDYNAQTYWLSANLKSFFKKTNLPSWLNIAIGYGAEGMFGAVNNTWTDANGIAYNENNIKRYRQFYVAPDIDFTRIKTRSKILKTTFFMLNSLKFPAPSIEFSDRKIKFNWIGF